jgi:amylosucrase
VRRYLLTYSLILGFGGLPLIYMGDELALRNYYDFIEDLDHADDNRWVHRPPMQWDLADNRHIEGTVEHRVWHNLRHLIAVRSSLPSLDASVESEILDPVNPAVLVFQRRYQTQTMIGVYNMRTEPQKLPRWVIPLGNWAWDALTEETPLTNGPLTLDGYQVRWLVQQT